MTNSRGDAADHTPHLATGAGRTRIEETVARPCHAACKRRLSATDRHRVAVANVPLVRASAVACDRDLMPCRTSSAAL